MGRTVVNLSPAHLHSTTGILSSLLFILCRASARTYPLIGHIRTRLLPSGGIAATPIVIPTGIMTPVSLGIRLRMP